MIDRRTTEIVGGKPVKMCRAATCETIIPDTDEIGVETGYCSQDCHLDSAEDEED